MRDSMIFYRSFYEAVKELPTEEQGIIYDAVFAYGLDGIEPDLKGVCKAVFTLIKPQLDANNKKFENGKKGGRPKEENKPTKNQSKTKSKPKANQSKTEIEANVNDNVNVNDNINVNKNVNETKGIPTFEDFKNYSLDNYKEVDLKKLELKYKSWKENDWKDGNEKKIKNWKSKILNTLPYLKSEEKTKPKIQKNRPEPINKNR